MSPGLRVIFSRALCIHQGEIENKRNVHNVLDDKTEMDLASKIGV